MDKSDFYRYFFSILVFIISLIILSSIFTFSNFDLESSVKLSTLTLMNTVNSHMTEINNFQFEELGYFTKISIMTFMIIGRVELISFLIIFKKFFFKN